MDQGRLTKSDILLVDEDLAWYHSSATTALWSDGFDVQLFAEVYVETKNIISRVKRITYHLLFYHGNMLTTGMCREGSTVQSAVNCKNCKVELVRKITNSLRFTSTLISEHGVLALAKLTNCSVTRSNVQ